MPGRQYLKCSLRLARRASRFAPSCRPRLSPQLGHCAVDFAAAAFARRAGTSAATLRRLWKLQRVRGSTHRAPPAAPPSFVEGDLWGGSKEAVGRERRTAFSLPGKTTHPPPLPVREGAVPTLRPPVGENEEVQAEGGS